VRSSNRPDHSKSSQDSMRINLRHDERRKLVKHNNRLLRSKKLEKSSFRVEEAAITFAGNFFFTKVAQASDCESIDDGCVGRAEHQMLHTKCA
jgi:hypothetical protein